MNPLIIANVKPGKAEEKQQSLLLVVSNDHAELILSIPH